MSNLMDEEEKKEYIKWIIGIEWIENGFYQCSLRRSGFDARGLESTIWAQMAAWQLLDPRIYMHTCDIGFVLLLKEEREKEAVE